MKRKAGKKLTFVRTLKGYKKRNFITASHSPRFSQICSRKEATAGKKTRVSRGDRKGLKNFKRGLVSGRSVREQNLVQKAVNGEGGRKK